ncbi:MAG: PH domain-containing protein [Planctomycetota bacterium]|nr:PH domain-containing protein [Planctomycetota bacterium]
MSQPADAPLPHPHADAHKPSDALPPAEPDAKQPPPEVIFKGPVSLWMGWQALFGAACAALAGLAILIYGLLLTPGTLKSVCVVAGGALLAAGSLMLPYLVWSIRCLRYTITTRLIEREKGLLFKRVDSLDLGRVKDVELTQSIVQRILKVGTIEIYSSDKTDPEMRIECIPHPRPVYEKLRDAVISLAQRRGIIPMDR